MGSINFPWFSCDENTKQNEPQNSNIAKVEP